MADKPLDLSKQSAAQATKTPYLSLEKQQESTQENEQNVLEERAIFFKAEFSKEGENCNKIFKEVIDKSTHSQKIYKEIQSLETGVKTPRRQDTNKRRVRNAHVTKSGDKRQQISDFASYAKTEDKSSMPSDIELSETEAETGDMSPRHSTSAVASSSHDSSSNRHRNDNGNFPFGCDYCPKRFKYLCRQKVHIKTHTGENSFVCGLCGKRFTTKWYLNIHVRTHSNERLYKCSECGKKFKLLNHLKTHSIIHTGHKPFLCSVCGRAFILKGNQIRHKKTHLKTTEEK